MSGRWWCVNGEGENVYGTMVDCVCWTAVGEQGVQQLTETIRRLQQYGRLAVTMDGGGWVEEWIDRGRDHTAQDGAENGTQCDAAGLTSTGNGMVGRKRVK